MKTEIKNKSVGNLLAELNKETSIGEALQKPQLEINIKFETKEQKVMWLIEELRKEMGIVFGEHVDHPHT